jgi:Zn-dependent protease with chaperone function
VLTPVAFAYSRFQEHEADRFALDLTHANHSGAMAFVKLQEENLSNPRPGLIYKIFRATHPSIGDRIDFCNSYHPTVNRVDSRFSPGDP